MSERWSLQHGEALAWLCEQPEGCVDHVFTFALLGVPAFLAAVCALALATVPPRSGEGPRERRARHLGLAIFGGVALILGYAALKALEAWSWGCH